MHCLVNVQQCLKHTGLVLSWPCKLVIAGHDLKQQAVMYCQASQPGRGDKVGLVAVLK